MSKKRKGDIILHWHPEYDLVIPNSSVSRQRNDREEEAPSAQHHAVGAGQQNAAVQVEQKPAVISSAVSSTVVAVRDPFIRPKYVCEICNKGFKSGYNLKRHTNDYHGENSTMIAAKGNSSWELEN